MKRTNIVFALLCTFFIVILGFGYSLPVEHQITMQRHYEKTPDDLWRVLVDYRKYSQWRENVYEITDMPSKGGYDAWKEVDADGHSVSYEIIGHSPGTRLIIEVTDTSLPYAGSWVFNMSKDKAGTLLKITENGKINNIFFRVIAHFFTGYTRSMNAWLNSLDNKFALETRLLNSQPAILVPATAAPTAAASAAVAPPAVVAPANTTIKK